MVNVRRTTDRNWYKKTKQKQTTLTKKKELHNVNNHSTNQKTNNQVLNERERTRVGERVQVQVHNNSIELNK